MKEKILERIRQLGGNTDAVKGKSLSEDLLAISFDTVLYPKPTDTPWAAKEETEPIFGLGEFIGRHKDLLRSDKSALMDKIIEKYYQITDEGYGQMFWEAHLFTPFKQGSKDFQEWHDHFLDKKLTDLSQIQKVVNHPKPDFLQVFYSYGYPDSYYICLSDPNPENPTLFSTDHEVFFGEVTNEGSFAEFLETFMTKKELIDIVKEALEA